MSKEWLDRVNAKKAENAAPEKVKGSGHHDEDKDDSGRLRAPQHKGQPRLRDHVIAVHDEEAVHFVGDCAQKAYEAIKTSVAKIQAILPEQRTGSQAKTLRLFGKLAITPVDGVPCLTLRDREWNDWLALLYEANIGLTGISADPKKMS